MQIARDGFEWDIRLVSDDTRELDDSPYITSYTYRIVASRPHPSETEQEVDEEIGSVTAYRLHGEGFFDPSFDMVQEADDEDAGLGEVAQAFYGADDPLEGITDDKYTLDVLCLATMRLDKGWRGHDLGLRVALIVIRAHGQGANLAMIPSPLEHREPVVYEHGMSEEARQEAARKEAELMKRGRAKLSRYWKKLGLVPVPGHSGMLWHNGAEKLRHRVKAA